MAESDFQEAVIVRENTRKQVQEEMSARSTSRHDVLKHELSTSASLILEKSNRRLHHKYNVVLAVIVIFGVGLTFSGLGIEVASLVSRASAIRHVGLLITCFGWQLVLVYLSTKFFSGYRKRNKVLRTISISAIGILVSACCMLVATQAPAVAAFSRCPDGANRTNDGEACLVEQSALEIVGTVALWVCALGSILELIRVAVRVVPRPLLGEPSTPAASVWHGSRIFLCTQIQLVGVFIKMVADTVASAQQQGTSSVVTGFDRSVWGNALLALLVLLCWFIDTPAFRSRILSSVWGLNLQSESKEAAALALSLAGKVASDSDGSDGLVPDQTQIRLNLEKLLDDAKSTFRVISFSKLSLRCFTGYHQGLEKKTATWRLGECDAFISHTWHDSGEERWATLRDWAVSFQRMNNGRAPLLWIDMACLNQANIQESLAMLPIHLSGTKRMICLVGPKYLRRIWCCAEIWTFISIVGHNASRLVVLPLDDDGGVINPAKRHEVVHKEISRFSIRNAEATNPADIDPIVRAAESFAGGDLDVFNEMCRKLLTRRLIDNTGAKVLQEERDFAGESTSMGSAWSKNRLTTIAGTIEDDEQTQVASTAKKIKELSKSAWILHPLHTRWLGAWDGATTAALIFTAIVTPIEAGFPSGSGTEPLVERAMQPLFWCNRFTDAVFLIDIMMNFLLAYPVGEVSVTWVTRPKSIAYHYLTTWFVIDFVSTGIFVFDFIDVGSVDQGDDAAGWQQSMKVVRVLRALKLVKLTRLLRSSRIVRRWAAHFAIQERLLSMAKGLFVFIIGSHWGACLWGLQASFHVSSSWMSEYGFCEPNSDGDVADECLSVGVRYLAAYFWTVNRISTVGASLADLPSAALMEANIGASLEVLIASVITLLSALLWVTTIAQLTSTFTNSHPEQTAASNALASVNDLATAYNLPRKLRVGMRQHMNTNAHVERMRANHKAIALLSPALQAEVCFLLYDKLLTSVWFLRNTEYSLRVRLALMSTPIVLDQGDVFYTGGDVLFILQQGMVMCNGALGRSGDFFGEDMILSSPKWRVRNCVRVMSNSTNLLKLNRHNLYETVANFPTSLAQLRRAAGMLALRRAVLFAARQRREELNRSGFYLANVQRSLSKEGKVYKISTVERALQDVTKLKDKEEAEFHLRERLEELKDIAAMPQRMLQMQEKMAEHERLLRSQGQLLEQLVLLNGGKLPKSGSEDRNRG